MPNKADIIFEAERMKYPHTGLFHYCRHLASALLLQQYKHSFSLGLYLPSSASSIFDNAVHKIWHSPFHKFFMLRANDAKMWHITNQGTAYFPWKTRSPILLTIHDLNFFYEKNSGQKQKKYLSEIQKKVTRADGIVTISNFVKSEILTHLIVAEEKIKVIYNGCNVPDNAVIAATNTLQGTPYIFSIGAIVPKKNLHVLPAGLVGNDLHFAFAGVIENKAYFHKIMEVAKKLGVEKRVRYLGPVTESEKLGLIKNCSLFCFPSVAEGFGLPVIEAMRLGKPVLLSTATSLPEIGGDAAFYLDNFEPQHVAEMVAHSIAHFSAEQAQSVFAWSQKFDWNRSAAAYWEAYEELCAS